MTDTTAIALIGGVASVTASLVAAYSSHQAAKRSITTAEKVDEVDTKTTEIKQLTNSHLSEITSQLKVALQEISGLKATALAVAKERAVTDQERADGRAKADLENGNKDDVPIPVHDEKVLDALSPKGDLTAKLEQIQNTVDLQTTENKDNK